MKMTKTVLFLCLTGLMLPLAGAGVMGTAAVSARVMPIPDESPGPERKNWFFSMRVGKETMRWNDCK